MSGLRDVYSDASASLDNDSHFVGNVKSIFISPERSLRAVLRISRMLKSLSNLRLVRNVLRHALVMIISLNHLLRNSEPIMFLSQLPEEWPCKVLRDCKHSQD